MLRLFFVCGADFCALSGFRRAEASGAGRIIQRRSGSGRSCGQPAVITVT